MFCGNGRMEKPSVYKWCFVPECRNTTNNAPNKIFITVPRAREKKKLWFQAALRDDNLKSKSMYFCCEDHFNIENDMEHYLRYKWMGGHIRMKKDIIPYIFNCRKEKDHGNPEMEFVDIQEHNYDDIKQEPATSWSLHNWQHPDICADLKLELGVDGECEIKQETVDMSTDQDVPIRYDLNCEMSIKHEILTNDFNADSSETAISKVGDLVEIENLDHTLENQTTESHVENKINLEQYKCEQCDKTYKHKACYSGHLKTHTPIIKILKCIKCDKEFKTKSILNLHLKKHDGFQYDKKFKCDVCDKKFTHACFLKYHMVKHIVHKCSICSKTFATINALKYHVMTHIDKKYKCEKCGIEFSNARFLKVHMKTHEGIKPRMCVTCGKTFTQSGGHSRIRSYKCDKCITEFVQSRDLNVHALEHTRTRPYKCKICNKDYVYSGHLRTHTMLTHPIINLNVQCKICDEKFANSRNLRTHILTHMV